MTQVDLAAERDIDFAKLQLSYEEFRRLAGNPHLSVHGRIGFPDDYRSRFEDHIFRDILAKLPLARRGGQTVVDIGPGCANLPRMLIELCRSQSHILYLLDSPEMLAQLPDADHVRKIPGRFPDSLRRDAAITAGSVDALLCYSVLHYLFVETNPFAVIDVAIELLAPGGFALFGDIPNQSKRERFFASDAGRDYHRAFTGGADIPPPEPVSGRAGKIDDGVLLALMLRAQSAGCDAYLVPQPDTLPMHNRRDDLIIHKP